MKKSSLPPPENLSESARKWWLSLQNEYGIVDPSGLLLLQTAMEAFDRMQNARALIDEEGAVTQDRFGQQKPHPAVVIERDARSGMLAALRALNLDTEPLEPRPGRPNGR